MYLCVCSMQARRWEGRGRGSRPPQRGWRPREPSGTGCPSHRGVPTGIWNVDFHFLGEKIYENHQILYILATIFAQRIKFCVKTADFLNCICSYLRHIFAKLPKSGVIKYFHKLSLCFTGCWQNLRKRKRKDESTFLNFRIFSQANFRENEDFRFNTMPNSLTVLFMVFSLSVVMQGKKSYARLLHTKYSVRICSRARAHKVCPMIKKRGRYCKSVTRLHPWYATFDAVLWFFVLTMEAALLYAA